MCTPFALPGIVGLRISERLEYKLAWDTFERIQYINSNVSTIKSLSNIQLPYYTYTTYKEREDFIKGQYLHFQSYPNILWNTVKEN
jgi:hypothetical protein